MASGGTSGTLDGGASVVAGASAAGDSQNRRGDGHRGGRNRFQKLAAVGAHARDSIRRINPSRPHSMMTS